MDQDLLREGVPDGEALRYQGALRNGGQIGFTDKRILIAGDQPYNIPIANLKSIDTRSYDWFLAVMSVLLVGIGVVTTLNNPVGFLFIAAGMISLYITHRKRGQMTINLHTQHKPIQTYVEDTEEFVDRLEVVIEEFEEQRDQEQTNTAE